jgi:CheY-like chemotaxis protein
MEKNIKVLFVDDEEKILKSLKRGLIDEEYECLFAGSGKEALEIMKEEVIAVIISDMRMPEMNGLSLLKEVEKDYPGTIKIILSGYAQLSQVIATVNQVKIFKYVMKPWDLENEFIGIIREAVDYYCMLRDKEKISEKLGLKNQAYVNIFKNISERIIDEKKKADLISSVGKSFLEFNRNNTLNMLKYYQESFMAENYIYDLLVKAIIDKDTIKSAQQLFDELQEGVSEPLRDDNICIKPEFLACTVKESKLIVGILLAYIEIYKTVYGNESLLILGSVNKQELPIISIVHGNVADLRMSADEATRMKVEIRDNFYNAIVSPMIAIADISFAMAQKNNNNIGIFTLA